MSAFQTTLYQPGLLICLTILVICLAILAAVSLICQPRKESEERKLYRAYKRSERRVSAAKRMYYSKKRIGKRLSPYAEATMQDWHLSLVVLVLDWEFWAQRLVLYNNKQRNLLADLLLCRETQERQLFIERYPDGYGTQTSREKHQGRIKEVQLSAEKARICVNIHRETRYSRLFYFKT
jgi:hypothetical protein